VAFIDRHLGGAGISRAISTEVEKHLLYIEHQFHPVPGGYDSNTGRRICLRSPTCHAEPGGEERLDREAAAGCWRGWSPVGRGREFQA
jgi:hypothetical protein